MPLIDISDERLANTVKVLAAEPTQWPDRCIVCDGETGEKTARIGWPFRGGKTRWTSVEVPICSRRCGRSLKRRRWLRYAVLWSVFFVTFAIGFIGGKIIPLPFLDVVCGVITGFTGLAVVGLWHVTHPLKVDFHPKEKSTDFEFRDREYAEEFAKLNGRLVRAK